NYFLFKSLGISFQIFATGSAQPQLPIRDLIEIPISLPPLSEQRAIAGVLSSLDDKIDLLHRQNKTLEALAQTLFRQWFVEEAGDDWEEIKLGDVVKTTSGGTPSRKKMEYFDGGTIPWVKSKELAGTYIIDTEEKITNSGLDNSSAKRLPENSILIAMYGATVGQFAILSSPATCNQAICTLLPNDDYPYTFLFMLIKLNKDNLINMAVGSAQQNISQVLIKSLVIPIPSQRIIDYHFRVEPIFEKIKANFLQIRTLEKLRDTLLPKLMCGEVRVLRG
ncbi:MAG: restriction endonuclease subunit S, partial [Candidatus Helarchaeota archaeon]